MTDYTASRPGQVNASGDALAIFLKVFSGEVMTAFQRKCVMKNLHRIRRIKNGKSAQFVAIGKASASYHTPGTSLTGSAINGNEVTISIDNILLSHVFVDTLDEAMSHYDVRGPYAYALGQALAEAYDKKTIQTGVLAARSSAVVSGGNGGSVLTSAGFETDGDTIVAGLFAAQTAMDEKDVPEEDRFFLCRPAQYQWLAQSKYAINKDYGDNGSVGKGVVKELAGFGLVKTNNLPSTNITDGTSENNTYTGDFSNTVGLAFQREAVGSVHLMELGMEQEYTVREQGTLMVAKMAVGHGKIRPECAIEFKKA
jgi:hypothetical protein